MEKEVLLPHSEREKQPNKNREGGNAGYLYAAYSPPLGTSDFLTPIQFFQFRGIVFVPHGGFAETSAFTFHAL